jgi:membrane protein implicated in regulation of membrane protease activity
VKRWNAFEDWLAVHLSLVLSSMKLFFLLNILIWMAILIQRPHDLESWLLAIISVWFQGVTLVIINRTSQIQGDRMEEKLDQTHEATVEILGEVHEIVAELHDHHIGGREHKKVGERFVSRSRSQSGNVF